MGLLSFFSQHKTEDRDRQSTLGGRDEVGKDMRRDNSGTMSTLQLLREASDRGDADAQVKLGFMYATGQGTHQNHAEAANWFRKAAEQGHAEAQINLGVMYAKGGGVPNDDAEAMKWWRKAADQGT